MQNVPLKPAIATLSYIGHHPDEYTQLNPGLRIGHI